MPKALLANAKAFSSHTNSYKKEPDLCNLLHNKRNRCARLLRLVEELVDLQALQQGGLVALDENRPLPPALIKDLGRSSTSGTFKKVDSQKLKYW